MVCCQLYNYDLTAAEHCIHNVFLSHICELHAVDSQTNARDSAKTAFSSVSFLTWSAQQIYDEIDAAVICPHDWNWYQWLNANC